MDQGFFWLSHLHLLPADFITPGPSVLLPKNSQTKTFRLPLSVRRLTTTYFGLPILITGSKEEQEPSVFFFFFFLRFLNKNQKLTKQNWSSNPQREEQKTASDPASLLLSNTSNIPALPVATAPPPPASHTCDYAPKPLTRLYGGDGTNQVTWRLSWVSPALQNHQNRRTSECIHTQTHTNVQSSQFSRRELRAAGGSAGGSAGSRLISTSGSCHSEQQGDYGWLLKYLTEFSGVLQGTDTCRPQQDQELSLSWRGQQEGPCWQDKFWQVVSALRDGMGGAVGSVYSRCYSSSVISIVRVIRRGLGLDVL